MDEDDPIIAEVRTVRERIAREARYDFRAIAKASASFVEELRAKGYRFDYADRETVSERVREDSGGTAPS